MSSTQTKIAKPSGNKKPASRLATQHQSNPNQYNNIFIVPKKTQPLVIKSKEGDVVVPTFEKGTVPLGDEDANLKAQERAQSHHKNITKVSGTPALTARPLPEPPIGRPPVLSASPASDLPKVDANTKSGFVSPESSEKQSPAISAPSVSQLNIYAPVHIPDWLIAVNEAPAADIPCTPLQHFHGHNYAATIGSPQHVESLRRYSKTIDDAEARKPHVLKSHNYEQYFQKRLQNEETALDAQLAHYSLYNHPVKPDKQPSLYQIKVPGLRENSPRIDLGDTVIVRPIIASSTTVTVQRNKIWREHGQFHQLPHPAFAGYEYHAVVWGVRRALELVYLRIDSRQGQLPPTANLKFVVQDRKSETTANAVHSVATALDTSGTLQSMLFPERRHACMQTKLSPATFELKWIDPSLNFEQQKAIAAVMADRYGVLPYLISGPPGTGKTKTLVETALQLLGRQTSNVRPHLLLCAPSDAAADTLALRLSAHLDKDRLFRLNGWTRSFAEVPEKLMLHSYIDANNMFALPPFHTLMMYSVVVTTCRDANMLVEARLTNKDLAQLAFNTMMAISPTTAENLTTSLLHWTALLLDEAAEATEPESLIPVSVILPLWQPPTCKLVYPQFILAGDEHQLGPRLALHAENIGLEVSLFQRLFESPFYLDHPLSRKNGLQPLTRKLLPLPRPPFTNLTRNYRSHPAILSIPSSLFYYDTLVPEYIPSSTAICDWSSWSNSNWPVLFIHNTGADEVDDILVGDGTGAGSLYNLSELNTVVVRINTMLHEVSNLNPEEIMVMSPFTAQVSKIRNALRAVNLASVNVGPLEAFQGLESRVVILCTTRTRRGGQGEEAKYIKQDQARGLGVIDEEKRFNMGITRAMEGLIVIGDAQTLVCTGDRCWRSFVAYCIRNGLMQGNVGALVEESREWDIKEGRLEKALRQRDEGVEGKGVMGLRGFVEDGEEEGEMVLGEEVDDTIESGSEEYEDDYGTMNGLALGEHTT